jgi:hypothetical protein
MVKKTTVIAVLVLGSTTRFPTGKNVAVAPAVNASADKRHHLGGSDCHPVGRSRQAPALCVVDDHIAHEDTRSTFLGSRMRAQAVEGGVPMSLLVSRLASGQSSPPDSCEPCPNGAGRAGGRFVSTTDKALSAAH